MSAPDEATTLRRRLDELEAVVAALSRRCGCGDDVLILKVQSTPTAAPAFVGVKAVDPSGDEVEGATVTLAAIGEAFAAANVGTAKPPADTYLIGVLTGGYWTTRYDGLEA